MRKTIFAAAVAAVCAGQMCGQAPVPTFDRLAVNDTLRLACYPFGINDSRIEAYLTADEFDRLNGFTKQDALAGVIPSCNVPDIQISINCSTCAIAVIDQVYGE